MRERKFARRARITQQPHKRIILPVVLILSLKFPRFEERNVPKQYEHGFLILLILGSLEIGKRVRKDNKKAV